MNSRKDLINIIFTSGKEDPENNHYLNNMLQMLENQNNNTFNRKLAI
jgi:hypothetical protein